MKRLFMTSTSVVQDATIVNYYGIVSAHIVAGTGFLTDFAAGLSDFFGGRSNSYRYQLESLYDDAIKELSDKASLLGANGILGLSIDMDNISGKGMSMFMITAVGTAAKIQFKNNEKEDKNSQLLGNTVSIELLTNAITKRIILNKLLNKEELTNEEFEMLLKKPENEYIVPLCDLYFEYLNAPYGTDYIDAFNKYFSQFTKLADRKQLVEAIYKGLDNKTLCYKTIQILNDGLFDAPSILVLFKNGFWKKAIKLLEGSQLSYSEADLNDMIKLEEAYDSLPNVGKIEMVKGGVFSKDGEKFICYCGQKNDPDVEFCPVCGKNIKGLDKEEVKAIKAFKIKIQALKELLSQQ